MRMYLEAVKGTHIVIYGVYITCTWIPVFCLFSRTADSIVSGLSKCPHLQILLSRHTPAHMSSHCTCNCWATSMALQCGASIWLPWLKEPASLSLSTA